MSFFANIDTNLFFEPHGSINYPIFSYEKAPIHGASAAMGIYLNNEYPTPGLHEDHEGFYVYAGTGTAKVGDEECDIKEGCCFYAPAGVPHVIKKDSSCPELKIFLFHFKADQ